VRALCLPAAGKCQKSIAESERAVQIGGPDPRNLCKLATAQAQMHRLAEAETSARAALRLDSGHLKANQIPGSILLTERRDVAMDSTILQRPICLGPALPEQLRGTR